MGVMSASDTSAGPRDILRPLVTLLVLGVGVHVLLSMVATATEAAAVLRHLAWWAVGLAVVAQAASYWASGYVLQMLVTLAGERLSVARGAAITLAASTMGLVAWGPVGAGAATHRWVRASGVGAGGATLATWVPPVLNGLALLVAALLGILPLLTLHALTHRQLAGIWVSALLLVGIVVVAWLLVRGRAAAAPAHSGFAHEVGPAMAAARSSRLRRFVARIADRVAVALDALAILGGGRWRRPVAGALGSTAFDALTLYLLFVAAGHSISPEALLAGYGVPLLLGRLTLLPGGVGVVETAMAGLYHTLGVPLPVAVSVVLAYRVLSFWLPTVAGVGCAGVFHFGRTRR
jgi:hypothetical protein